MSLQRKFTLFPKRDLEGVNICLSIKDISSMGLLFFLLLSLSLLYIKNSLKAQDKKRARNQALTKKLSTTRNPSPTRKITSTRSSSPTGKHIPTKRDLPKLTKIQYTTIKMVSDSTADCRKGSNTITISHNQIVNQCSGGHQQNFIFNTNNRTTTPEASEPICESDYPSLSSYYTLSHADLYVDTSWHAAPASPPPPATEGFSTIPEYADTAASSGPRLETEDTDGSDTVIEGQTAIMEGRQWQKIQTDYPFPELWSDEMNQRAELNACLSQMQRVLEGYKM